MEVGVGVEVNVEVVVVLAVTSIEEKVSVSRVGSSLVSHTPWGRRGERSEGGEE